MTCGQNIQRGRGVAQDENQSSIEKWKAAVQERIYSRDGRLDIGI